MRATASPRRDDTMTLADGRTLAFSEWGRPGGRPIVLLHGMPGSRLMCPDLDATVAAGVRLITVDRPGYGASTPTPQPTLIGWADDFRALTEHLDLSPCPVVGWSSGGLYALAAAARLGDQVTRIGLAGSPGLLRDVPGSLDDFTPEGRAIITLFDRDRAAGIEAIERAIRRYDADGLHVPLRFRATPSISRAGQTHFMVTSGDGDDRILSRPDVSAAIDTWLGEGARQGTAGLIADWIAQIDDPGFSTAEIELEVHVMAGGSDRQVPRRHADALVALLPHARLSVFAGEGHLFLFDHWADMLEAIAP